MGSPVTQTDKMLFRIFCGVLGCFWFYVDLILVTFSFIGRTRAKKG